ncbi:NHL repeat-containing protein [Baekduia alba]|uniref:NHL repeat-containing protein n=1 Tax=Baekduia alba TaxID=2997333 RepID=UPI002341E639|nr:NHL repeat-containing protein [Baekduia alba]
MLLALGAAGAAGAATWSPSAVGEAPLGGGVFRFPQAVAVSPGGQTVFVGDQSSSVVQAFGPDGAVKFSVGFQSTRREAGRIGIVGGVATDRSGHVYVLDAQNERVQAFDASDGHYLAQFGDASVFDLLSGDPATIGGGRSASGLAVVQGPGQPPVVYVADQGNERVERFVLDPTTLTPTGAPALSPAGVDLSAPQGIALDPGGTRVYVADDDHHRVVVLRADTLEQVGTIGSEGAGPGQMQNPYDVAVDGHDPNRLFVADNLNNRVDVFDATSFGFLGTLGAQGYGPGTGNMAIVRSVGALTDTPGGGVDVADTANDRIQAFDVNNGIRAIWGTSGRGPGYFTRPEGVAFAPDGGIAVADSFDERIGLFAADGTWTGLRGQVSASTGFATEGSNPGQYNLPHDAAYDGAGNLWVADTGNNRVQELGPDGAVKAIVAVGRPLGIAAAPGGGAFVAGSRDGVVVRIEADGTTTSTVRSGLAHPAAVAVAPDGTPFVADDVSVRNVVDNALVAASGGGTAWDRPSGLGFGPDGALYVAEQRPGTATGARVVVSASAAGASWATLADEGNGAAQVIDPGGLAVSADGGTVLVADTGNDRVLRLDAAGHAPPPRGELSVAVSGIDRGTVVSDLPGIACVSDCAQHFGVGRTVTLTARPRPGSVLSVWTGACSGSAATCTVTMSGDQHVGVIFAAPPPVVAPPAAPVPAPKPRAAAVVLTSVRLSTHALRPARKANRRRHVRARKATRATGTVRVTRPATLSVRVQVGRPGRRAGSSCVAITKANRRRAKCTRYVTTARAKSLKPGAKTVRFAVTSSFGASRTLPVGSYRLSVAALDADGNRSGPRTVSFKVVR